MGARPVAVGEPNLALATILAAQVHRDQLRDGEHPLPYAYHPFDVVRRLREHGVVDQAILTAAALHDAVEEGDLSFEAIEREFGAEVASLVREVTREEPPFERTCHLTSDALWRLRSEMLLAEIARMSPAAQTIKLADRLSNLHEALRVRTGKRLRRYLVQTEAILEVIPESTHPSLWQALQRKWKRGVRKLRS